jgi:LemA protein
MIFGFMVYLLKLCQVKRFKSAESYNFVFFKRIKFKIMKYKNLFIILGIIALLVIMYVSMYNKIIKLDQNVKSKWAFVESAYQRRLDLIPNLVNTVQGYADFEKSTLTQVIEARSKATSVTIDPTKLNAQNIQQFQQTQDQLTGALSRLMVVVEKYPDLKANQNFLDLQAQLEGTENRINVERNNFNEAVKGYNSVVLKFPQNILFHKEEKGMFTASKGAEQAPVVNFK